MQERNKLLYKCLLFASAIVMFGSIVVKILTGNDSTEKIVMPIITLICDVTAAFGLYIGLKHPEKNMNYTLKVENGKLRFKRHHYPADPEGLRLVSSGILTFLFTLLTALMSYSGNLKNPDKWISIVSITIFILMCIGFYTIEKILARKEQ